MKTKLLAALLILGLLCPFITASAASAAHEYTVAEVEDLCGGIVAYKEYVSGASSAQGLIDGLLCDTAGSTAEYYIITLSQSGSYDFSAYEKALKAYLSSHEVYSATTREKYALALIASGSTDSYIKEVCDSAIGGQGLMSLVFGLHLLNNGYSSSAYSAEGLISTILSYQLSDGGWAVIGSVGDVDVTAMTVQALAPWYGVYSDVTYAVDRALALLSERQLSSGGFVGMGAENLESSAQVLTALSSLGIDQSYDDRFIKDGNTVLDAMLSYRNADGSFAHTGSGYNENATIQAFYSMRAYLRMRYGQSPLYILDRRNPAGVKSPEDKEPEQKGSNSSGGTDNSGSAGAISTTPTEKGKATEGADSARSYPTQPAHGEYVAPTGSYRFQPEATAVSSTPDEAQSGPGYKLYAVIGIIAAALIVGAALFIRKKRNIKNYIALVIIAGAAIAFVLLTSFESRETYESSGQVASPTGTVTMSIRCDTISGEADRPMYIPDDGIILDSQEFDIGEDSTAYDVLLTASKTLGLHIDNRGAEGSAYIAGIEYLYEFDYGSLSGWMYRVNGEFPEVGCQSYKLSDGDRIEWLYTTNIGKDL